MRTWMALLLKGGLAFFTLAVWGQATGGPSAQKALGIALVLAVVSWVADLLVPFSLQGVTRWALDGLLAGVTIFLTQSFFAGPGLGLPASLFIGLFLGAVELPIHFFLAARFGADEPPGG
jgi:hypothetical protein